MIIARDRVYPATRALAATIVPFLLLGSYVLYLRTDKTQQLWVWHIRSPMSALMLASAYAAGACYFSRTASGDRSTGSRRPRWPAHRCGCSG
jgi:hypothetical protein